MSSLLPLLIVLLPFLEIYGMVKVWSVLSAPVGPLVGLVLTAGLLLAAAVAGIGVMRRVGQGAAEEIGRSVAQGEGGGWAVVDTAAILAAGLLLIIPGFFTDLVAVALLVPPTRWLLGRAFGSWLVAQTRAGRLSLHVNLSGVRFSSGRPGGSEDGVIETVGEWVDGPGKPPGSELGRPTAGFIEHKDASDPPV